MEIASLISRITPGGHVEESRINGRYSIGEGQDITELVDELREYLPKEFTNWMKVDELREYLPKEFTNWMKLED